MQKYRQQTASKGKQTAHTIAEEIWNELAVKPENFSPLAFVPADAETETINLPLGKAKIITHGLLQTSEVQIGTEYTSLGSVERSEFVKALAEQSVHGKLEIPVSAKICQTALLQHERKVKELNKRFYTEAATFSADENMQEKIVKELWRLVKR